MTLMKILRKQEMIAIKIKMAIVKRKGLKADKETIQFEILRSYWTFFDYNFFLFKELS